MTAKEKATIEIAATKAWEADARHNPYPNNPYAYMYGFKQGADEVIEHPERYDLVPAAHTAALQERVKELEEEVKTWRELSELSKKSVRQLIRSSERIVTLEAENERYRQTLESIATRWNKVAEHNEMRTALHLIQQDVFEAIKQEEQ